MIPALKHFFDGECRKVLGVGTFGAASTLPLDKIVPIVVGALTALYIAIKIIKQIRDWKRPDKD